MGFITDYLSCDINQVFNCKDGGGGGGNGVGGVGISGVSGGSGSGNGGNIINVPSDAGASCFEISSTFYIPSYNQGYIETITYYDPYTESTQTVPEGTQRYRPNPLGGFETNCAVPDPSGDFAIVNIRTWYGSQEQCVKVSSSCNASSVGEGNQIAIYRFALPASSNNLNSWFLNDLKRSVGNGYLDVSNGNYWDSSDSGPMAILPSSICSGSTCQIKDVSAPEDSYIAYGAKILGNYANSVTKPAEGEGGVASSYCVSKPNKFLKKIIPEAVS